MVALVFGGILTTSSFPSSTSFLQPSSHDTVVSQQRPSIPPPPRDPRGDGRHTKSIYYKPLQKDLPKGSAHLARPLETKGEGNKTLPTFRLVLHQEIQSKFPFGKDAPEILGPTVHTIAQRGKVGTVAGF